MNEQQDTHDDEEDEYQEPMIRIPENFKNLAEYETWLHRKVCLTFTVREYVGYFSADGRYQGCILIEPDEYTLKLEWNLSPAQKNLLRGKTVTHNHPSEGTFSYDEVLTCADLQFIEFRVVTPFFTYSLRPKDGEWPPWQEIQRRIEDHIPPAKLELFKRDSDARHRCYESLSHEGYFKYEKTPRFY
jgi:hypothetical protein